MDCSTQGLRIHHQLLEFTQTHVHWVSDAIQPSYHLSSPSPTFNLTQHQGLFSGFRTPPQIKSLIVSIVSLCICHEVMGLDAMIFVFQMLSFKPTFLFSFFTFIKRLYSSSSLSAIRVVSCAYLMLLIFLLAILIPACASSSPAFCRMYSAYNLNKHGDNIQPWPTPSLIWSQSVVPFPVLTVAFNLHTDFLGGRWGGLVFPSLEEFSTICCDPHSHRLWCSQ